ncbi:MAG: hypothetical protein AB7E08_05860 [Candidatus Omnitrophota bacterium]
MKIFEVDNYEVLWRISRLIDKGVFKGLDYTADDFFRYLIENFDKDAIKVFASVNGTNQIEGFVICSLAKNVIRNTPQVFIDLAYIDKKVDKNVGLELLKKIEDYARKLNINEICGFSLKGERAVFDKYGFELDYKAYIKRLDKQEVKDVKE